MPRSGGGACRDPALGKPAERSTGEVSQARPAGLIDPEWPEWTFARLRSVAALEPRHEASKRRPALFAPDRGELTEPNSTRLSPCESHVVKRARTRPCSVPSPVAELALGDSWERACLVDPHEGVAKRIREPRSSHVRLGPLLTKAWRIPEKRDRYAPPCGCGPCPCACPCPPRPSAWIPLAAP